MAYASVEQRQVGLKKEASRGVAETAPTKWIAVDKDTQLTYGPELIKDEALRGIPDSYPLIAGVKNGSGKLKMPLDAQTCGELFFSLLGANTPAQQGGSAAYKHTMTRDLASLQRPAYTFFQNYGASIVKKYNLGVVKAITLTGVAGQLCQLEADVLFKSEADGSIGSPVYATPHYMSFQHFTYKLGGSAMTDLRSFQLKMDLGSQPKRFLNQSQDIADILATGEVDITGNVVVFFQNETERAKFLANTTNSMEFLFEEAIIASTYKYTVDIILPKCHYTAYPFGEQEGLLAATVNFAAKYDTSTSKTIQVEITNTETTY